MTTRHQFLRSLHELLQPATYLEIGVQTGRSLQQAGPKTFAVGVDPAPCVSLPIVGPNIIYPQTSDAFFAGPRAVQHAPYDLAFIDGMHLVEFCLRDFMGVERLARPDGRTVAVFDDVLPYSAAIAGREPLPGDWTGDCWKIIEILKLWRPDLTRILVDVDPTGALVVLGVDPRNASLADHYADIVSRWTGDMHAPDAVVERVGALQPADALDLIRTHLNITEA
jgi:hypothetical protein